MRPISLLRLYGLLVLLVVLLVGSAQVLFQRFSSHNSFVLAPHQWAYTFSDSQVPPAHWQKASQLYFPNRQQTQDLWLKIELPPHQMRAPSLWIRRINQNFEVFQGEQPIYRFGDLQHHPSQFHGYTWHLITLPRDIVSQTLYFRIHSEHRFVGVMSEVYFASQAQLLLQMFYQNLGFFMLGCLFVFIGLFALGMVLFLPERLLALLFGLFCLLLGVYTLCEADLTALWLRQPFWLTHCSLFSLYFTPGCVYLFIRRLSGLLPLQRPLLLLSWLHLGYACISLLAVLLGLELMKTVLPFQILNLLRLFSLMAILMYFWPRLDSLTQVTGMGILAFSGTSLLDLLVGVHWLPTTLQPLYPWGCLLFVLALLLVLIQRFFNLYQEQIQVAAELSASLASQAELQKAKEQAEEANRLKSQFLANLSHEIRTPLNAVMGFSELLGGNLTDPQQRSYLVAIQTGGKALLGLLNDLLDLSKIEAGKLSLELMPCDLRYLCREIASLFSLPIQNKGLSWSLEIGPELPPFLLLDELRVRQILLNLIGNAVKFTERGQITLRVTGQEIAPHEWALVWQVQDTGVGIPREDQKLIFEPFHQQDGQSTRKYVGTGLGLAICKRLAQLMGGRIAVDSEPGQGSIFTLYFQAKEADAEAELFLTEPEAPAVAEIPAFIILSEAQRKVLKMQLEPLYLQIQKQRNFKLIRRLAEETVQWGEQANCQPIQILGQALAQALQQFEIEQVTQLLEQIAACWQTELATDTS